MMELLKITDDRVSEARFQGQCGEVSGSVGDVSGSLRRGFRASVSRFQGQWAKFQGQCCEVSGSMMVRF